MTGTYGDSTRSVKSVVAQGIPGEPVAQPLVPVAAYHLGADEDEALDSYGRKSNPTWRQLESALIEMGFTSSVPVSGG